MFDSISDDVAELLLLLCANGFPTLLTDEQLEKIHAGRHRVRAHLNEVERKVASVPAVQRYRIRHRDLVGLSTPEVEGRLDDLKSSRQLSLMNGSVSMEPETLEIDTDEFILGEILRSRMGNRVARV